MRIYTPGETVLLSDDTEAVIVEAHRGAYELPPGQNLGGGPNQTHGGEYSYTVKVERETRQVRDRDVRNPPKSSGKYTPYVTPEQQAERARKGPGAGGSKAAGRKTLRRLK